MDEEQIKKFIEFISQAKMDLNLHRQIAFELNCSEDTLEVFDKTIGISSTLEQKANNGDLKVNYLNQFQSNINSILGTLQFRGQQDASLVQQQNDSWKSEQKVHFENNVSDIKNLYHQLDFNLDFFNKIGFFNSNVVAIGANGSGKTTLSNKFKTYLQNNGIVISAQRILLVPNFNAISNPTQTATELKQTQSRDKTNKNEGEFGHLQQEFGVVLKNLLAENISAGNTYRKKSIELDEQGLPFEKPNKTKLDKTFLIWNSLIEHRTIDCSDGMNINAKSTDGRDYPAIQMSDGEKVMLYLIGQVLQAPESGFIVVDEPEMYLHKTILKKLWDILETERQDCLFIYLTHDLDFATSRTTAKKIWIKSFTHPDNWEIEDIPENEIPESLLFELLGSRKNILFCEGQKGSIDERVFSILFPELTIMPVGGCFDVINHTKAFNKLPSVMTNALGLIDSDHQDPKRLKSLESHSIYSFNVSEVENLLLDESFLKILAKQLLVDKNSTEKSKSDTISELANSKDLQASNYVSAKINYYFKDSHVSKGNNYKQVEDNYKKFEKRIEIKKWYEKRIKELDKIITIKDYNSAISVFNNKGLKSIISKHFKISDFTERSLKLLQNNVETHKSLLKYFPKEIKKAGNIR